MVCERINNCKTSISKKDGHHYKFEYEQNEDMPDDYKILANGRPRKVSDEDKKRRHMEITKMCQKRKYICPRCHKTMTNGAKIFTTKFVNYIIFISYGNF